MTKTPFVLVSLSGPYIYYRTQVDCFIVWPVYVPSHRWAISVSGPYYVLSLTLFRILLCSVRFALRPCTSRSTVFFNCLCSLVMPCAGRLCLADLPAGACAERSGSWPYCHLLCSRGHGAETLSLQLTSPALWCCTLAHCMPLATLTVANLLCMATTFAPTPDRPSQRLVKSLWTCRLCKYSGRRQEPIPIISDDTGFCCTTLSQCCT